MRRLVVAAAVLALSGPPAAARPSVPALGGVTIVEGARAAAVRVRVPATARFSAARAANPDVTVRGAARFAGIVLASLDGRGVVIAGRADASLVCANGRCERPPIVVRQSLDLGRSPAADPVIPAGEYRLFVLADGPAVSVRVRFHGLRGAVRFRPAAPAGFRVATISPAVRVEGAQAVFWGGTAAETGRRAGIVYSQLAIMADAHAGGSYRFCESRGEPALGWLPGCAGAESSIGIDAVDVRTGRRAFVPDAFDQTSGGVVAVGWSYAAAAVVRKATVLAWWLTTG